MNGIPIVLAVNKRLPMIIKLSTLNDSEQFKHVYISSSPRFVSSKNSCECLPPIVPTDPTAKKVIKFMIIQYQQPTTIPFIINSLARNNPNFVRNSSRYFGDI
ncbi:hypothetical protein DERP_010873 [Dermatophagoides pteronyssinus]|uniref:Uncharacterized protein n=1 Tax=Dermatophagoides pteronyssinus TaxID=6956 RepID=A0ABQ8JUJ2_DERPT|nr:hypothetical protein DERP_010873 [Dermatophagoides pteronyssinus]